MVMKDQEKEKINRRDVLKTGMSSIGVASLPKISAISSNAAKREGFHLGDTTFVESSIYYEVPEKGKLADSDGKRRFIKNTSETTLGFIDDDLVDRFPQNDMVVHDGRQFFPVPSSIHRRSTSTLKVTKDIHRATDKALLTESTVDEPRIDIQNKGSNEIILKIDNEAMDGSSMDSEPRKEEIFVSPGELKETALPEVKVDICNHDYMREDPTEKKTETIHVVPKLFVKNNGRLSVFGKKGYSVVPYDLKSNFINQFIGSQLDHSNSKIVSQKAHDLFIIEKGVRE